MKTPLIFKLDCFILTNEIINQEYVVFSEIPAVDSVTLLISEFTNILQNKYQVLKIIKDNISTYPEAQINKYVLSWKNSEPEIKSIFINNLGEKMTVQYVNFDTEQEDVIEKNKEDNVDWDI